MLGSTLFAAAGLAILAIAPLIWDEVPDGLTKVKPSILGLVGLAGALLGLEWLGVH